MLKRITHHRKEGNHVFVLVFDGKNGKHKLTEDGNYALNPIETTECISMVDARCFLLNYLRPSVIPYYKRLHEIVNKDGYLSVINHNGRYTLG